MTVYINLEKPLTLQVLINRNLQRIEYESLLIVCFSCGQYGHLKEVCPQDLKVKNTSGKKDLVTRFFEVIFGSVAETDEFEPWMMMKRKTKHNPCEQSNYEKFGKA